MLIQGGVGEEEGGASGAAAPGWQNEYFKLKTKFLLATKVKRLK